MKAAVLAFLAVVGYTRTVEVSWDKELDALDFSQMNIKGAFDEWKVQFNKNYASVDEEYRRFTIFTHNLQRIAQWNSDTSHGARLRANQFADLEDDEFRRYVHGDNGACYSGNSRPKYTIGKGEERSSSVDAPASVDWTTKGVVTPVKDQGQCGSCWAFSATGATECRVAIATGKLVSLSEQELVDCSKREGNLGCNGGQMDAAFKYIKSEGGLCSESEYPYKAKGGSCAASSCGTKYDDISGYTDVKTDSETSLVDAAAAGCVSVAIEADQFAFQYYSSGILDGTCGTNLDHGVLVVGYGTDGSEEYWKVKNSWGTSWGEQGYVRICRECNKNRNAGECGILEDPSYPIAA